MADDELTETRTLAARSGRDGALGAALDRLGGRAAAGVELADDVADLRVTAFRRLPASAARYAPFPAALDTRLQEALAARGISQFYTHQAEAVDHALAGRHVVVVTPTASGKTLCYNAPVLHSILQDPSSRALYLFPTKALAQDQLAELQTLAEKLDEHSALGAGRSALPPVIGLFTYVG